jgi:hypothetical protein
LAFGKRKATEVRKEDREKRQEKKKRELNRGKKIR